MPKFGTTNALLGYFWGRILKNYCHIWNQQTQICQIVKFLDKTKLPKFWTKNAFYGYFWGRLLKNYCHIWNQHAQICLLTKFCHKTKIPKFETKTVLFEYFWGRILKKYCHISNQHPQICQKWFLVYGTLFLKVRGPLFLKVRAYVWVRFIKNAPFTSNFFVVQKIWKFSRSILSIFINFFKYFLTFSWWKEANNVSI